MKNQWNNKSLDRLYRALLDMDKNIHRLQAIADGRVISLSSKEPNDKKEG